MRLFARDKELKPERVTPGAALKVLDARVRITRRTADPLPNAPLLKRIVRYPYRLETTYARRSRLYDPLSAIHERLQSLPPVSRLLAESHGPVTLGNPLRSHPLGVEPRTRPSVEEWLGGQPH